jgi:S1-C subfamily serine protease
VRLRGLTGWIVGAAALTTAGCGAKPASTPEHAPAVASECSRVLEQVGRFEETLQLAVQEEKDRESLASALRMMRRFDRGSADLNAGLDAIAASDRALRGRIDAYRAATRELGEGAEAGAAVAESVALKMTEPLALANTASVELDHVCAPTSTDADCKTLQAVFKKAGSASASLDGGKIELIKASEAIRELHPRRAKVAAAQTHVLGALDGLVRTYGELEHATDGPRHVLEVGGERTKKAGASLRELCGKAPTGRGGEEFVTESKPDLRALTVVVSFKPPGNLAGTFERAATNATEEDEGGFYRAAAAGGFGSGFVVVRRTEQGKAVFIVTNRHVVELADHVVVTRNDGVTFRARIVYSDPHYDLAVLSLDGEDQGFDHGFDLETNGVHDEEAVVATGFPGLGHRPSYQITKGYVSNDRFELDSGGLKLAYIQHTAPIDRGSSGGPLMSESGKVLGVNTLKATGREGVAFAAPSGAVVNAVRYASSLDTRLGSAAFRKQTLRDDCLDLVAELEEKSPRLWRLAQLISTRMISEQGVDSFNAVASDDEELRKYWQEDPVDALRFAVAKRVRDEIKRDGGVAPTEMCSGLRGAESDHILTSDLVHIPIGTTALSEELSMRWEQGRWKLAHMDFAAVAPSAKAKAKARTK